MISTISNTELERELIVSKILCKILLPKDYTELRIMISEIPYIDTSEIMPLTYPANIVDKNELLKDNIIESYYKGKDSKLLEQFVLLHSEIVSMIPIYNIKIAENVSNIINKISESTVTRLDFDDTAFAVNSTQSQSAETHNYDDIKNQLIFAKVHLENVLSKFGIGTGKIPKESKKVTMNLDYKIYLYELSTQSHMYISDPTLAIILGRTIDAISSFLPTSENLDPFKVDVSNNILMVLTQPENFYTDCKLQKILDPLVGTMFNHCYPEFYHKFLNIYLEDYDNLSYQEQITIRNSFGLVEDNSQLTNLCSSSVNQITQAPKSAQGV